MPAPINAYNPQGYYTNNPGYNQPGWPVPGQYPYVAQPYPYPQTAQQQMTAQPQQQSRQVLQMIPVDGIEQVKSYPTAEATYFFDKQEPVFYIKDATSLRVFDYVERNQNESKVEYVTKAEFEELKKMLDDLTK